uniref:Uncharacterized protein n=1 Tax=Glossina austeni TaxID=7395 RepID=A0A1A9V914_GLOAU
MHARVLTRTGTSAMVIGATLISKCSLTEMPPTGGFSRQKTLNTLLWVSTGISFCISVGTNTSRYISLGIKLFIRMLPNSNKCSTESSLFDFFVYKKPLKTKSAIPIWPSVSPPFVLLHFSNVALLVETVFKPPYCLIQCNDLIINFAKVMLYSVRKVCMEISSLVALE